MSFLKKLTLCVFMYMNKRADVFFLAVYLFILFDGSIE